MSKLISVTLLTGLLTLARMGAGFLIAKVVAIYTGPAGIGMLGQFQGLITALNGVVTSPVGNGVVRYTSQNIKNGLEECAPWWRASLTWSIIIFCCVFPLAVFFSKSISEYLFHNSIYYWLIIVSCALLPLSVMNTFFTSIINGQQLYKKYVTAGFISVFISTLVMISLIIKWNLNGAMLAVSLNSAIAGLMMLMLSIKQPWLKLSFFWGEIGKKNLQGIFNYVLMAITSALAMPLALVLIRNIMVNHVGWEETGLWQATWKISEAYLAVVTLALSTYYLPKLSSLENYNEIKSEIFKTALIIMPIVCCMAVSIYLLRDVIINVLFTHEFRSARDIFAIQLVGDVIKILSWIYAFPMLARGATKWFVCSEVIFSLTFVLLAYFFIFKFGVQGASLGFAINYLLYFVFVFSNLRRFTR